MVLSQENNAGIQASGGGASGYNQDNLDMLLEDFGMTQEPGLATAVPEPASWVLLALGLLAIVPAAAPRRRRGLIRRALPLFT